ncbi:MAG: hypothetical protein WC532_01860 [Candidatus Omnitrophota bacterium]
MEDIKRSLERAIVEQGWCFGDKATRIGLPFEWTENERKPLILSLKDLLAVGFYFSMYYVQKKTPDTIITKDHDKVQKYCREQLYGVFKHFFPFLELNGTWKNHIESQALARAQDYCFIKRYCDKLPKRLSHGDIGAGLGTTTLYSLKFLNSTFYALEASPMSYSVQRNYFRFVSPYPGAYLDVVECENFQLTQDAIRKELGKDSYRLKHVPTWRFGLVPARSLDLLTATFVLNELNYAGILWLLAQASRTLRKNGYFYIRDSFILKAGTHSIDYDKVLLKIGFQRKAQFEIANRHDFFGIPRLYRKISDKAYSFDEMVEMCLGKFASVASGSSYAYNMESTPKL